MSRKKKAAKEPQVPESARSSTVAPTASPELPTKPTLDKPTRKRAADFMSDEEDNSIGGVKITAEKSKAVSQRAKKQKGLTPVEVAADRFEEIINTSADRLNSKRQKKKNKASHAPQLGEKPAKVGSKETSLNSISRQGPNDSLSTAMQIEAQGMSSQDADEDGDEGLNEEAENANEDHAPELLAGFDSDHSDAAADEGLAPDAAVPALPNYKKTSKKLRKAHEKGNGEGPGTVYVGRIPHGFFEHQMRAYFSQFGKIIKLRLSRNRRTGASKHFAFIQFEHAEVAKIVAQAMDNYLMFGHILKCKFAPEESLHPDVWKGANRRYRKVPHNKLEKARLDKPKSKEQWTTIVLKEQKKREKKAVKLKEMGYDIELPKMTSVDEVTKGKNDKLAQVAAADVPAADEVVASNFADHIVANDEQLKTKKSDKRAKKATIGDVTKASEEVKTNSQATTEQQMPSFATENNPNNDIGQSKSSKKRKNKEQSQISAPGDSKAAKDPVPRKPESTTHVKELPKEISTSLFEEAVAEAENGPKLSKSQRKKMAKRQRIQSAGENGEPAAAKPAVNTVSSIAKPEHATFTATPPPNNGQLRARDGGKNKSKGAAKEDASEKVTKRKAEGTSKINDADGKKKKKAKKGMT